MRHIIDSYAWVEYFIGSDKGQKLHHLFQEKDNSFSTVECCLAEIHGWCLKNNQNFDKYYKIIVANSKMIPLNEKDWIDAAKEKLIQRKKYKNFGLIDAIILTKQKQLSCKVISGDSHFKELKDVVFME